MNGLASRNVLYNVLYEHELTPTKLKPYAVVALLTADTVCDRGLRALQTFVEGGGKLFAIGQAAARDENGKTRARPAWFRQKLGKGETTYWEKMPPIDELAKSSAPPIAPRRHASRRLRAWCTTSHNSRNRAAGWSTAQLSAATGRQGRCDRRGPI